PTAPPVASPSFFLNDALTTSIYSLSLHDALPISIHWGMEYRRFAPARHRVIARAAIDAGFDIVHGHSAHVFQGVEFHRNGVILYDTGNYVNDFRYPLRVGNDRSFLFLVEVEPGCALRVRMIPVVVDTAVVNRASTRIAENIRRSMCARSRGYT